MAIANPTVWYCDFGPSAGVYDLGTSNNASGATLTLTGVTVPAGSLIVVVTNEASGTAAGTLSDGGSNTYGTATGQSVGASSGWTNVYYAWNSVALNNATLTFTKQVSGRVASMSALYATNVQTSSDPLDTAVTAKASGTTSTPSVTSGTPAVANELVVGVLGVNNASALTYTQPATSAFAAPLTANTGQATAQLGGGSLVNFSTATIVFNPTLSGTPTANAAIVVAFKTKNTIGGYWNVTAWVPSATPAAGVLRRQRKQSAAIGNERVFACVVSGASGASEPSWSITKGAKTTDNAATWIEVTGQPGVNGDTTNSPVWAASQTVALGQIIYDSNTSSLQVCTTAGTTKALPAPSFSATAGVTTTDNTATWTSLGLASNFAAWAAPHARYQNAIASTWATNGDKIFLGDDHAEWQASLLNTAGGTQALPIYFLSIDHAAAMPPVSASLKKGASVRTTGNSRILIANAANANNYWSGATFYCGSGVLAVNPSFPGGNANSNLILDGCTISLPTVTASTLEIGGSQVGISSTGARILFNNTVLDFAIAGHSVMVGTTNFTWRNTPSAITGTAPTTLLWSASASDTLRNGVAVLDGVDLSALGAGNTIVGSNAAAYRVSLTNCKLGASVTVAATPAIRGSIVELDISDSATNQARQERYLYEGTLTTETTVVPTSQQASDGTTPITWKVVTTANASWPFPFETFTYAEWIDTTGSPITRTFEIINDGTTLTNTDVWAEAEYLGSSATPVSSLATSGTADILAAGVNITTSAAAWNTTGLSSPVTQKIAPTFTPQMKGYVRIVFKVAKASKTLWINPRPNEV